MEKLNWHEAKEYLTKFNRDHGYSVGSGNSPSDETTNIVVVFTKDSFNKPYTLEERSYRVSSNNKAFIDGMGGYSIYAQSLDGSDFCRIEQYMQLEHGGKNGWKVDYCYIP